MLYVKSRKSFKVRRQKKFIALPCVTKEHTANHDFALCFGFAVCFLEHTR